MRVRGSTFLFPAKHRRHITTRLKKGVMLCRRCRSPHPACCAGKRKVLPRTRMATTDLRPRRRRQPICSRSRRRCSITRHPRCAPEQHLPQQHHDNAPHQPIQHTFSHCKPAVLFRKKTIVSSLMQKAAWVSPSGFNIFLNTTGLRQRYIRKSGERRSRSQLSCR